ncbi:uncharacterized protein LOC134238010 [Saccostrea cucullata]|uniref:uncharacterized protein LOC134238010 n=1 Tax=Saccostrea cuccullata TaxID=36930 RepID=UPI002ED062CC
MVIQYKMIELQHDLDQLEREMLSQLHLTEIKSWQNFHGESLRNLETELQILKLSTKNLKHSVEEQRSLVKTTIEKQLQLREDMTKSSEGLLELHAVYVKHFTYPQACVDKAKDDLKLYFEVERGKIFETLYKEKLHNFNEMLESHLTNYHNGSSKEENRNSSNKLSSEPRLTKKVLAQILYELKRSMQRWIMTSQSTLHFLQRIIRHQDSEIVQIRMWTVTHVRQKFKHNEKSIESLNVHLRSNTQDIMVLNVSVNTVKSLGFSYPSLAYTHGRTCTCTRDRKCKNEMRRKEIFKPIDDDKYWDLWKILLIPTLLITILWIYFCGAKWFNRSFENIKNRKKTFYEEIGHTATKPLYKEKLENSLCVISFGRSTDQQKYVQMASDLIGSGFSLQMKKVVVNSTECLDTLPPSKAILMFVDYNERNLIVEEEQGGLKRKTLSMLQRTGGIVFLILLS